MIYITCPWTLLLHWGSLKSLLSSMAQFPCLLYTQGGCLLPMVDNDVMGEVVMRKIIHPPLFLLLSFPSAVNLCPQVTPLL